MIMMIINGRKLIPYVQLRLKHEAFDEISRYPKSTLNNYGKEYRPHYVVEFDKDFLLAFMKFLFSIFDDNPQQYIEIGGSKIITHQHKSPIYRMSPFDKYFNTRHDLPGIMYSKAVQLLLAHELAHVGCGHLDLQANDKDYGLKNDVIRCEEDDADGQAIYWVLAERFLEMEENKIEISLEDLFQELSLSIFAVYLLFTWDHSANERKWSITDVLESKNKRHLPYQLRAYNALNYSYSQLLSMGKLAEKDNVLSLDNKLITIEFMQEVFMEVLHMINSFEHSLHMFFARTIDVYELFKEGDMNAILDIVRKEQNDKVEDLSKEYIPWLLGYEDEAQEELQRVHNLWKEVRERLTENGTYCKLAEFEPWVPLNKL